MADLTHGSDLRLAPAIGPLVRSGLSVRQALDRVRTAGFEAITLDGTVKDLRARHLSRQARRDVAATLRRANLEPAGLDLFIPRPEFLQADTVDRALAATLDAIELAADLGNLPVHLALPVDNLGSQVREALLGRADTCGVTLGVHAEDALDPLEEWIRDSAAAHLGIGLDPAALLATEADPVAVATDLGDRLVAGRLADHRGQAHPGDSGRCPVGEGDLDLDRWRIALDLAAGRSGPVILDLRQLENPLAAMTAARDAWENAGFSL